MKKVIIPQKMSGTGSIYDIASVNQDREIKFPKGDRYAVVLAAIYGGKGCSTHGSESATIQADKRNKEYSHQIVGVDGWVYHIEPDGNGYDMLVKDYDQREPYEVQSNEALTQGAAAMGGATGGAKAKAARLNGRKGGRPRKLVI